MNISKSVLIMLVLLLSACQQAIGMELAVPSPVDSYNDVGMAVQYREVEYIESVLLVYPPAWPEEIQIVINGFLHDGCTEIYSIKPFRHENEYTVKIYTKKEVGVDCTTALVPFEKTITLDTSELIGGNYSVVVYGISTNFSLEISADSIDTGG
jgi:hypothetical protein